MVGAAHEAVQLWDWESMPDGLVIQDIDQWHIQYILVFHYVLWVITSPLIGLGLLSDS